MSKTKLELARELIKEKKYDAARSVLVHLDDPIARKWLAELNRIAPSQSDFQVVAPKNNVIAGISSVTIIATLSIMIFVTFLIALYGAFLRPTSEVKAESIQIEAQSTQIESRLSQVETQSTQVGVQSTQIEARLSQVEAQSTHSQQWEYLTLVVEGQMEGPFGAILYPSQDQQQEALGKGISVKENGVPVVTERLNTLGGQGWELVSFTHNYGDVGVVFVFKRPIK
jgi:hypothetical protein